MDEAQGALSSPWDLALDGDTLFVAMAGVHQLWTVSISSGRAEVLSGSGAEALHDGSHGDAALMQHQQGIALADDGRLLVCDSFNDALKWVDPVARRVDTWVRGLHEPSGVAIGERFVYVADTNAHRVAVIDRRSGQIGTLIIE